MKWLLIDIAYYATVKEEHYFIFSYTIFGNAQCVTLNRNTFSHKMKNKRYHSVGTVPKSNRIIDTINTWALTFLSFLVT